MAPRPDHGLADSVLPRPLYRALVHVFAQGISDCMLVGGTALAGYYAGHRRSDDLDLFARNEPSYKAAVLAVKSLRSLRAVVDEQMSTAQFFSSACHLDGHAFTVQVVLDPSTFEAARALRAEDGVWVAELETLLKLKAATLLSRCSEKDLYDLEWILAHFPDLDAAELIALGAEIDGGMTAEAVLTTMVGTPLALAACGFSLSERAEDVHRHVTELKAKLERAFDAVARKEPPPRIAELIRKLGS